jgi:two-component system sensor histidine kinase RpfC
MPDMTGPDIVKLYRAASIGAKRLPIMILSADATPTARQESLTAGADAFLTKPVSSAALIAAVDCLFSRTLGDNSHTTPEMQDSSATQELLDADRMTSLNDVARGDARFLKTYFLASFEDIERALFALRSAIDSGESRPARDALHIIEGTGASIGGKKLVHDCRVLRGVLMNARECEPTFAELSTSYALIKSAILAQLSARDNLEVSDLEARGR